MNEIQKFLYDNSVTSYGVGMLTAAKAMEFVGLCKEKGLPIHGFDGFHRRTDMSPTAVQIDQDFSANYPDLKKLDAYKSALNYFQLHVDDGLLYQVSYDFVTPDYNIVRSYMKRNARGSTEMDL